MKNIHILPTDKPSRLVLDDTTQQLILINKGEALWGNRNIYIINDEEIKEGDWYLTFLNKEVIGKPRKCEDSNWNFSGCKKIILTTDTDLIKDGVQAIDDEFLGWFVKNPSCERVEVKRNKKLSNKSIWDAIEGDLIFNNHNCGGIITMLSSDVRVHITSENGEGYMETAITSDNGIDTLVINNYKVYEYTDYKIIIPKEEPKQEWTPTQGEQVWIKVFSNWSSGTYIGYDTTKHIHLVRENEEGGGNLLSSSKILPYKSMPNEPKQETLEEAAESYWVKQPYNEDAFIEGAKWQAERMYSEADKIMKFLDTEVELKLSDKKTIERIKWYFETYFEQFKKK